MAPVRARTLLLGDSFSGASRSFLAPLFSDLTIEHCEAARVCARGVVEAMVKSDVVAYETVERTLRLTVPALLDTAVLDAIEAALAANPRRL